MVKGGMLVSEIVIFGFGARWVVPIARRTWLLYDKATLKRTKVKVQNKGGGQPNTDFTMKRFRPRVEDFTVGWISALPIEHTAATAMLDEEYDGGDDTAQYTLGRIGTHNV